MVSFLRITHIPIKNVFVQLDLVTFYFVVFSLPFGKSIFVPLLFCWLCLVFISYFVAYDYSLARFKGIIVLPILFYLLHVIGVVQSANIQSSFFDIQMKLSLFLLPLLYPYQRESYKANRYNFLWTFVAGCAIASLYCFGNAIYQSYSLIGSVLVFNPIPPNSLNNYFYSTEFSYLIHPSYFALYLLVSLLIIGIDFIRVRKGRHKITIAVVVIVLFLITSLIMLQSRAGILGFGLLAMVWIFYLLFAKKKFFIGVSILVTIFGLIFFVFNKSGRYMDTTKSIERATEVGLKNQYKEDGTTIRYWIWKSAIIVIKEHPIWGVGTGDVRDEMLVHYKLLGMDKAIKGRLNAHNQYLESWLGVGVLGFLSLLAMLIFPLLVGLKRRDWLLVGFICFCSVSFMFESMLNSIAGVGFFAIFYTMLVSCNVKLKRESI